MKRGAFIFLLSFVLITLGTACKKPYLPPAITAPNSYLVVEGVVIAGTDSTFIKLSRTVKISSTVITNPVDGAVVNVEGDDNSTYPLIETKPGIYASSGLNLDVRHNFRLHVKTSDAKEYLSDFVAVVNSPPIDSVYYRINNNGVNIYVDTHDPKNSTHYYRWDYKETWIIRSFFKSEYVSNGDTILPRDQIHNNIWQCWLNDTSSTVLLGTSARLAKDVISQAPITFISSTSEKFTAEYSINVRQYGLTSQAYNFWQNILKNTEQIGSIFDALPSEIEGNIHCVSNPAEPVVGFLSVGSTVTQRIFIRQRNLPAWEPTPIYAYCQLDPDCCVYDRPTFSGPQNQVDMYMNPNFHENNGPYFIPIDAIGPIGSPPIGYTTTSVPLCVDCTVRGSNKQPDFWEF